MLLIKYLHFCKNSLSIGTYADILLCHTVINTVLSLWHRINFAVIFTASDLYIIIFDTYDNISISYLYFYHYIVHKYVCIEHFSVMHFPDKCLLFKCKKFQINKISFIVLAFKGIRLV